jgi:Kef-type K+ transport system membrane component KefB
MSESDTTAAHTYEPAVPLRATLKYATAYALMFMATVAGFLLVRQYGSGLQAPAPATTTRFGAGGTAIQLEVLLHVLLALVLIILFARLVGLLFRYIHQPPVVGEIIAGIMLGPSLLGRLAPRTAAYLLPSTLSPFLSILAQVGILLYMFLVGIEFEPATLRRKTHSAVVISHASIMAPFLLGTMLSVVLYPRVSSADVPFNIFALFLGVSMSVTAFPVLARILTDRSIHKTSLGVMALTCAAVDDVTAWCLLAFLVSMVQARVGGALLTLLMTLAFIVVMTLAVRPAVVRWTGRQETRGLTRGAMTVACVGLLVSSLVSESIGIHAIFGAFLMGTLIPHDSAVARQLKYKLEDLIVVLFLPAYFAFTGMRTQIGLLEGMNSWLLCIAIIAVASAGKFGGSFLAARLSGSGWRDSVSLGVLMNTRGLMELIVLNIGLDLKVISPTLFAMLVIMALATTLATAPILRLILGPQFAYNKDAGSI